MKFQSDITVNKGYGRLETRKCTVTGDIQWLCESYPHWKNLNSIIEVQSQREIKGELATEKCYCISSMLAQPMRITQAVREH